VSYISDVRNVPNHRFENNRSFTIPVSFRSSSYFPLFFVIPRLPLMEFSHLFATILTSISLHFFVPPVFPPRLLATDFGATPVTLYGVKHLGSQYREHELNQILVS
jgi:hypothetical protein